jgi:hypothetical protein
MMASGRALTLDNAMDDTAATPEFVLEVLRDSHRQQCAFDPEADPSAQLSFETSVAEWRNACDLVGTKDLGVALGEIWGIAIPPRAWEAALEPPKARTLRDVCELIASQAQRALVQNAGYFGAPSRSAGAFFAIRSLLLRAGADAAAIRPSAPIADAARRYPHVFLGPISRLAPGRLPTVTVRTSLAVTTFLVGLVVALVLARGYPSVALASALVAGFGLAGTWIAARFMKPAEVRFGAIVTFRDLAMTIAGEQTDPVPASENA